MRVLGEHQDYAETMMDANDYLGIGYKPGTGKTMCALSWIYHALQDKRIMRALVICPAPMVVAWKKAIDDMSLYEGYTKEGIDAVRRATFITSFQKTYRTTRESHKKKNGDTYSKPVRSIRPEVDHEWGVIAIDESHCIGAHNSVQTKVCHKLATHAKYRFALTGTPVSGGGGDADYKKLYGQIKFLDPGKWKNWSEWKRKYVLAEDQFGNPSKYNVEACKKLLEDYFIFCTLESIRDIPGMEDTVVPCELEEKKVYKDIKSGNILPYGIDIEASGTQYIKLLQICSGSMKREEDTMLLKTSKDAALRTILEGTDDKVVIFCNFRASIDRVEAICKEYGKTVVYDGRSKGPTWKDFQYGDARYLVAQYQSGGTGLDLFASATMVLWEPTLSSLILEQTKARTHRTGQDRVCRYLYLSTPKTIEEKVWNSVRNGMEVTIKMMEQWSI